MNIQEIKELLLAQTLDEIIRKNFASEPEKEKIRYRSLCDKAEELYGDGDYILVSAPGRSEIIGNHTDHQRGHAIAAAVNIDTLALAKSNEDGLIRIYSPGFSIETIDLSHLEPVAAEHNKTESLIRGIAAVYKDKGFEIGGFDAVLTSNVKAGSGISSSASFEILICEILNVLYNDEKVDAVTQAIVAQRAENVWFGKPCGLEDQMAISCGGFTFMDFTDKDNPQAISYDFSFEPYHLVLTSSKGDHSDLSDEYASMPNEMKQVAQLFGYEVLSQLPEEQFYKHINECAALHNDRAILRAIHFFDEDKRVLKAREAIVQKDVKTLMVLMKESGNSSYKFLQNAVSLKHPQAQSYPLSIALSEHLLKDKGVTRVHGGGLAGTIQAIVPDEMLNDYCWEMERVFGAGSTLVMSIRRAGGFCLL